MIYKDAFLNQAPICDNMNANAKNEFNTEQKNTPKLM